MRSLYQFSNSCCYLRVDLSMELATEVFSGGEQLLLPTDIVEHVITFFC
jgi:hypothetical protein